MVPLPDILYAEAVEWAAKRLTHWIANESSYDWGKRNKQYRFILPWLWTSCVESILSAIDTNLKSLLPRVWWNGTGVASSLRILVVGVSLRFLAVGVSLRFLTVGLSCLTVARVLLAG